jgi:hypothetical protein
VSARLDAEEVDQLKRVAPTGVRVFDQLAFAHAKAPAGGPDAAYTLRLVDDTWEIDAFTADGEKEAVEAAKPRDPDADSAMKATIRANLKDSDLKWQTNREEDVAGIAVDGSQVMVETQGLLPDEDSELQGLCRGLIGNGDSGLKVSDLDGVSEITLTFGIPPTPTACSEILERA